MRVEGLYNHRWSRQLYSPINLDVRGSNGISIARDQIYNPFGTANGVPAANALAFTGASFRIQRFVPEVGNRDMIQRVDTYRALTGLDGTFQLLGEWRWDATAIYSKSKATFDSLNGINYENVQRALGSPAICAGTAGCVPLNIFGPITTAQADYVRNNYRSRNGATQYDASANVSRTLFQLPGGALGFAAGYEYRRESAYDYPDAFAFATSTLLPIVSGSAQSPIGGTPASPTTGKYDLHEVYAEIDAPLLSDLPAIYRLNIDAAVRYSKYSSFGGKATSKVGVSYRPIPDVMLRGTYSEGFRAPSILELYQSQRGQNFVAVDPCNGGGAGKTGCAGVPAGYNQALYNGGLIAGITSGNTALQPETAKTLSAGVALTPTFAPRLSLTVDWFKIKVNGAIASQTATQVLTSCAATGTFCDLVVRNATGEVARLVQAVVNLSRIEVSGVDATLRYAVPTSIGNFEGSIDASYLDRFRTTIPQPDGSVVVDERAGKSDQPRSTFPHWKGQASLRYIGSTFDAGVKNSLYRTERRHCRQRGKRWTDQVDLLHRPSGRRDYSKQQNEHGARH